MKELNSKWLEILEKVDYAFQPVVDIHTGICYGYEALLRKIERAGFDSIRAFFDEAYKDEVLHLINHKLFERSINKLSKVPWVDEIKLFFNVDNRMFKTDGTDIDNSTLILQHLDFPQGSICVEISERHEILFSMESHEEFNILRKKGFRIAVDDFGVGFSGLKLLYQTRPDYIKMDRFFIQNIEKDMDKQVLATSIVNIAHHIGSIVVAEGIETESEYYTCKKIGCDLMQGYLVQYPELDLNKLRRVYDCIKQYCYKDRRSVKNKDQLLLQKNIEYINPIPFDEQLLHVLTIFKQNPSRTFFPIINQNDEPIGIIREESLKPLAYSQYGRYILSNPTFYNTLDQFISKVPVIDINASLEKILNTFSIDDRLEGILITENMKYAGFLRAQSLLKVLNEKKLAVATDQNPLTKLAGNNVIYEYISNLLQDTNNTYYLIYFDFDNFKAYNDMYGFRQGDRIILLFSEILKAKTQSEIYFIGHIGGDDFFMGIKGRPYNEVIAEIKEIAEEFHLNVESFYNADAIQRGYIISTDREGNKKKFPLITVSAVILEIPPELHRNYTPDDIGNYIATLKKRAKKSRNKIAEAQIEELVEEMAS